MQTTALLHRPELLRNFFPFYFTLFLSGTVMYLEDGFGIPFQAYAMLGNCDGPQVSIRNVRKRFKKVGDSSPCSLVLFSYTDLILLIVGLGRVELLHPIGLGGIISHLPICFAFKEWGRGN